MKRYGSRAIPWMGASVLAALSAGCSNSSSSPPNNVAPLGEGKITAVAAEAQGLSRAFDATPSPDGKVIYYTALGGADGDLPGTIYRADPSGPAVVATGFVTPVALVSSTDGATLFVADSAVQPDPTGPSGAIYSVAAAGGTPMELTGTRGLQPRGLDLVRVNDADVLYFTGVDPADKKPGVWRVVGGNVEPVAKGDPMRDPSGVAVTKTGDIYVADTTGSQDGGGALLRFTASSGKTDTFLGGLRLGYPAGIALSPDEKVILVSGLQQDLASALVYRVQLADATFEVISGGISQNTESAGVHRAHAANVAAWADGSRSGTVYRLTLQ